MKKMYPWIFLLCFCLIPYFLNGTGNTTQNDTQTKTENEFTVLLYRSESDRVDEIALKEYLCGVVSAEMQANYEAEALKAQAVAACTYTLYRYENYNKSSSDHPEAYVCDDYTHCKSYLSKEDAKEKWGEEWFEKYYGNIQSAVEQVYGQVITYDGKVINAVFHAISSGTTESAENVWGSEVPYLVSVNSSVDTAAAGYESVITFKYSEIKQKLSEIGITVSGSEESWFAAPTLDSAGSVESVNICGQSVKGTEIRKAFGLRSTAFSISADTSGITFTVHGYGHQVGMSQNGANELAKQGESYSEILKHYYSGVEIQNYIF